MKRVVSFTTTRREGDARAPAALVRLLRKKHWPTSVATAEQIHGDRIIVVPALRKPVKYEGADGLLTAQTNQPLTIFTADCAAIFLADQKERMAGVLHAGWRGVHAEILRKAVQIVKHRWGVKPKEVVVWLGPCIGPCCFEVQWDVARYFPYSRRRSNDRWTVDLVAEIQRQARQLGVQFLHTKGAASCTMHGKRFYSFRRDGTNKRLASVIMRSR